jgi:hypothetical protein
MKKIIIVIVFLGSLGCNQDKKNKEEKTKIRDVEFTSLEIQNKYWVFNTNEMINLFKTNIEVYKVDQVRDFLKWKKDGDNNWENDEYELLMPKKPWAVKLDNGSTIFSDTAIDYLKSVLPKYWRLPNTKDLKELDDFLKGYANDSLHIQKYINFEEGYSCQMMMIIEVHGVSLDCFNTYEEYPIWLDNNEIFWFRNGSPVFDKQDPIYSNHFDVFAAPVILIYENK